VYVCVRPGNSVRCFAQHQHFQLVFGRAACFPHAGRKIVLFGANLSEQQFCG
jgi:hypothetical protein